MCLYSPKELDGSNFDEEKVSEFYSNLFSDLTVDPDENENMAEFFGSENTPPNDQLINTRASAFRIGCDHLTDERDSNVKLFRCINAAVHAFEMSCLCPKPFELAEEVTSSISVEAIGLDASIEQAVQHLWDLDVNRLKPGEDYIINVQSGKSPYNAGDEAREPLFIMVDKKAFNRPTYKHFLTLMDNYISKTGTAENISDTERSEIRSFLLAIMQTGPMQFCHKYCHAQKPEEVPEDKDGFMKLLHGIWFELYSRTRGGRPDSSGFEHVFVGEVKDDKVSGFHNWINLYMEEKKGTLDYKGYIKPRSHNDSETNSDDHILTLQFDWNGVEKSVGTSFIGVSPEFEMALYTTCFLMGQEDNKVSLDTGGDVFDLNVKCYTMARGKVGTSYPEALSHYED